MTSVQLAAEKAPLGLLGTMAEICCSSSELTSNVKVHELRITYLSKTITTSPKIEHDTKLFRLDTKKFKLVFDDADLSNTMLM